ncbi:MAG: translocation/assembly module TamB domain-containing protein [Elusimicrobiota bacterium]
MTGASDNDKSSLPLEIVKKYLHKKYLLTLEYADVKYSFPNTVTAGSISIKDPNGRLLIRIDSMVSDIQLKGIFIKEMLISKLSVKEAYILIDEDDSGKRQVALLSSMKKDVAAVPNKKDKDNETLSFSLRRLTADKIRIESGKTDGSSIYIIRKAKIDIAGEKKPLFINMIAAALESSRGMANEITDITASAKLEKELLTINTASVKLGRDTLVKCNLTYPLGNAGIMAASFNIDLAGKNMNGNLKYDQKSKSIQSSAIEVKSVNLSELLKLTGRTSPLPAGIIDGRIEFRGNLQFPGSWRSSGAVTIKSARYRELTLPDLYLSSKIDNGNLDFRINQSETNISLKGKLTDQKNILLDFNISAPDTGKTLKLFTAIPVEGSITGSGYIKGSFEDPDIFCDLTNSRLSYASIPFNVSRCSIRYYKHGIFIDSMKVEGALDMSAVSSDIIRNNNLGGRLSYTVDVSGPSEAPEGNIDIVINAASYKSFSFETIQLNADIRKDRISIRKAGIIHDNFNADITGDIFYRERKASVSITAFSFDDKKKNDVRLLKADMDFDLNEQAKKLVLNNVLIDLKGLNNLPGSIYGLAGKLSLDGTFSLENKIPGFGLSFTLLNFRRDDTDIDNISGTAGYKAGKLLVEDLNISNKKDSLDIYAEIPMDIRIGSTTVISRQAPLKLSVKGAADLRYIPLFLQPAAVMSGKTDIDIRFEGSLEDPGVYGKISLADGFFRIKGSSFQPIESAAAAVSFYEKKIDITRFDFRSADNDLKISGTMGLKGLKAVSDFNITGSINGADMIKARGSVSADNVDISVSSGKFSLSIIQPFLSSIKNLTGTSKLAFTVSGDMDHPEFAGYIKAKDFGYSTPDKAVNFSGGIIDIKFENEKIRLERIEAGLNEGMISISGTTGIRKRALTGTDIKAVMTLNRFDIPDTIRSRIKSVNLWIKQNDDRFSIAGDIDIDNAEYFRNIDIRTILLKAKPALIKDKSPSLFSKLDLNINILKTENILLRNNLGKLKIGTECAITGPAGNPVVMGKIYITSGYVLYLDRTFDIQKGMLDFNDPLKTNPFIDIIAVSSIRSYRQKTDQPYKITLAVKGYRSELSVSLTSEPPLSEPDIVSLITIGATSSELTSLTQAQGSSIEILADRLGAISSRSISGYISANVGNMLNLDQIYIDGNILKIGSPSGATLRATKRVTKNTALTYINSLEGSAGSLEAKRSTDKTEIAYETGIGHTNEQKFKLGYKLSKFFMFQSHADITGNSGISLKYSLWKK